MLDVKDIHFAYAQKQILRGVSFSVQKGEIIALIGVSGSGKTTLFRLITSLIQPEKGQILINGSPLSEMTQEVTYMRQEDLLLPWRTTLGNLLLFSELGAKKTHAPDILEKALALLQQLGLSGYEKAFPNELSAGMRQRVSLARALLQNRPLFLLDEPFSSLDVIIREELYTLLRAIRDQFEKTMVMVTHDFRDACALADRILVLSNGLIKASFDVHTTENLSQKIRESLLES